LAPKQQALRLARKWLGLPLARKRPALRLAPREQGVGGLPGVAAPQEWVWIVLRQPSYKCDLNFTGLSVFVPLNTDGFARAFARARVGRGPLAPNRKSTNVPNATITADGLETLKVRLDVATQITFDQ